MNASAPEQQQSGSGLQYRIASMALVMVPILALLTYFLLPESTPDGGGFSEAGRRAMAAGVLIGGWWMTEALPIAATSLLPIILFPFLGIATVSDATSPYADPLIFLFMGGFLLALGMERWDLHKRFALIVVNLVGTQPRRLIAGFMIATATLSMWVSNTATTVMMLPIGMSVIQLVRQRIAQDDTLTNAQDREREGRHFALCLLLGIAYAASVGGIGTIIGSPPNALLIGFLKDHYAQEISFGQWMRVGLPVVFVLLPLIWWIMTHLIYPIRLKNIQGGRELIRGKLKELGPVKWSECCVFVTFVTTALCWVFRKPVVELLKNQESLPASMQNLLTVLERVNDSTIAMAGALILFILPARDGRGSRVMDWEWGKKLPWGVLLLFGGGLSLASALGHSGVTESVGYYFSGLSGLSPLLIILIVVLVIVFLGEFTSNTAATAAFLPMLAATAIGLQLHPYILLFPAAIGAACGFMMPAGTPPNAIVFASGQVTIPQMCRAGIWLDLLGIVVVTVMSYFLLGTLLGVDLSVFPTWAAGK